jgi:Fic family protein
MLFLFVHDKNIIYRLFSTGIFHFGLLHCVDDFKIEFIHPFNDGNGRMGRLWQSLILYKYNKIFEYLPIETLVYENQQKYYNALALAEKDASATVFIEFMLDMILKTIETFSESNILNKIHIISNW